MAWSSRNRCLTVLGFLLLLLAAWNNLQMVSIRAGPAGPAPAASRIPRVLHQVSRSELVFAKYLGPIQSCLRQNPDWTYVLWRDADAELLIQQYFPDFYKEVYTKYTDSLQKADSIRYIILYLFGGVYIDMDVECRKPFFPALAGEACFLDQENPLQSQISWDTGSMAMNSVMGCRQGHPFMLALVYRMRLSGTHQSPLLSTGPMLLTNALNDWQGGAVGRPAEDRVTLLGHEVFSPYLDNKEHLMKLCKEH